MKESFAWFGALGLTFALIAPAVAGEEEGPLVGETTRQRIEQAAPDFAAAVGSHAVDAEAAKGLVDVPAGAELTIVFGTWCGDSRREVSRFWQALDAAGGEVPFAIRWIAVDREKQAPGGLVDGLDIRYVPTFIVRRDGKEVGRIVETSPSGVEVDLRALLTGGAQGFLSASRESAEPTSDER